MNNCIKLFKVKSHNAACRKYIRSLNKTALCRFIIIIVIAGQTAAANIIIFPHGVLNYILCTFACCGRRTKNIIAKFINDMPLVLTERSIVGKIRKL